LGPWLRSMCDADKNRPQLLEELRALRRQVAQFQQSEGEYRHKADEHQSEQQLAHDELRESEDKLRLLAEHIHTVFWLMDAAGTKMLYVSPAYEKVWGRTCQSLYDNAHAFLDAAYPEDREKAVGIFQHQIREGHVDGEYRIVLPDGSVRWTWVRGYSVKDAQGAITRHVGICEDITERKEHELSRSKLAAIVESSEDAIVSMSLDGIAFTWNHGAERLYGFTAQEVIGHSISILIPPDGQPKYHAIMERMKRKERISNYETVRQRKDGSRIEVSVSITPIVISSGEIVGSSQISRDITRINQLERQNQQAQKMEAIGTLAGGVAHDFNNMLTIIISYCDLLLDGLAPDDPSRCMLDEIRIAGERAAMLTRQLLAFSRQQILEAKVLDLNHIVNDTEKMLRRLIGEDIIVSLVLDPALRPVKADAGQIQQVLMNLAANARDAMPEGGRFTIETQNVTLDEAYCQSYDDLQPGEYSLLAATDNGTGMDEKTKARIFEPFFTTKEVGKGTGLGLPMVFGIAKQSGGHVEVYTELGQGSTFKVYLPQVKQPVKSQTSQPGRSAAPKGCETLLLAEDEETVRVLARRILQSCGYKVLEAANGQEAIRLAESHEGAIDLLVSDVVMPHLSGRKLAEQMVKLRPGVKVLFVSGYTDDAVIRHGVLEADFAFLQKPFTSASLLQKVRDVLDRPLESQRQCVSSPLVSSAG
jgi:two-component system cell cycle sensor histidine kinase/response regulator CckA